MGRPDAPVPGAERRLCRSDPWTHQPRHAFVPPNVPGARVSSTDSVNAEQQGTPLAQETRSSGSQGDCDLDRYGVSTASQGRSPCSVSGVADTSPYYRPRRAAQDVPDVVTRVGLSPRWYARWFRAFFGF